MKKLSFTLLAVLVSLTVSSAPYKDGDVVVFFGDSITHGGLYHEYVTDFYRTRYPDANVRFVNSGIGGDTAAGAFIRIPEDVVEYAPTHVAIHFGMNDINRGAYFTTSTSETLRQRERAQRSYRTSLRKLIAEIRRKVPKAAFTYLTPTHYDDTAVLTNAPANWSGWASVNQVGCNVGLSLMAGAVLEDASADHADAVDWFSPLNNLLMEKRRTDAHFMLTGIDRVHPGALGHSIMAWEFLRQQGVDPVVSAVEIDASVGKVVSAVKADVGAVEKTPDGGITFDLKARSLPFPIPSEARPYLEHFKVEETLNRETVVVKGLAAGRYALRIDGETVGEYSDAELAKGVSLGFNEKTPQYRQAQKVFAEQAKVSQRERALRNHHSARWFYGNRKAPVDDVKAFADWFEKNEKNKGDYFARFVPAYLTYWPTYRETREKLWQDQQTVRKLAQPVSRRYEVVRSVRREATDKPEGLRLRFGVLADIHVDERYFAEPDGGLSVRAFKTALECLRARAVDGVVICGDLTQEGRIAELRRVAATWWEVFPNDRLPDGSPVQRLFAFGDHDVERPFLLLKYWPEQLKDPNVIADLRANHIAYVDRAKVWKDVFHEDFSPIDRRTVKGYDFVLAHLVNADEDGMRYADPLHIPGLEEFFATNSFDRTKPFFYVQHKIPRGTVGGRHQSGQDSGRTTAILSKYPNAVGFCGHKHRTATEELSLWQGAFTQFQSPAIRTLLTAAGRENSRCSCEAPCSTPAQQMEASATSRDASHALVVSVYDDRMTVDRIDIWHGGEAVAEPWTVRLPNDGSSAYERRGETAPVPQFAAGAKVSVAKRLGKDRAGVVTNQVVVSFPPARSPRAYDYEVTAVLSKGVVTRIVSQKRVYSPMFCWPERLDTNDVVCVFGQAEIPDNHESVKFVVRPMNAWGKAGEPIASEPDAYWSKGPLYPF